MSSLIGLCHAIVMFLHAKSKVKDAETIYMRMLYDRHYGKLKSKVDVKEIHSEESESANSDDSDENKATFV